MNQLATSTRGLSLNNRTFAISSLHDAIKATLEEEKIKKERRQKRRQS